MDKVVHEYGGNRVIKLGSYHELQWKGNDGKWRTIKHDGGYYCQCTCLDGELEEAVDEMARLAERNKKLEELHDALTALPDGVGFQPVQIMLLAYQSEAPARIRIETALAALRDLT